ncbi:MAG: LLM class F420-dependent oxidoreductase, partial [Ilumatobacter sp.]|nr:LLM class F420-dependent oxidoreductase [Ilumatobacter sp.]
GGFALAHVVERARWLTEAAGERDDAIERSILVQSTYVGDDADAKLHEMAEQFEMERALLEATPFVLVGSVQQVVDKLERLRRLLGVSHVTVRDADGFAPIVEALAGR